MWELLYEEFWDKLEHFCYKLCRDDGRAEDLTQEVFLRALQNRSLIENFTPGQCKAWLFAAARNLYCDQVRRAVKEESLLALLDPDDAETPDETAEAALGTVDLDSLLGTLDRWTRCCLPCGTKRDTTPASWAENLNSRPEPSAPDWGKYAICSNKNCWRNER